MISVGVEMGRYLAIGVALLATGCISPEPIPQAHGLEMPAGVVLLTKIPDRRALDAAWAELALTVQDLSSRSSTMTIKEMEEKIGLTADDNPAGWFTVAHTRMLHTGAEALRRHPEKIEVLRRRFDEGDIIHAAMCLEVLRYAALSGGSGPDYFGLAAGGHMTESGLRDVFDKMGTSFVKRHGGESKTIKQ